MNIVQTISRQPAPAMDGSHLSPFMASIMSRLALWCVSEGAGSSGKAERKFGKAAAEDIVKKLRAKEKAKTPITFQDIASITPFTWLVDDGVLDDLKKWTADAAKSDLLAGAAAAVHGAPPGTKGLGRKRTAPDARALVLACIKD